MTESADQPLLLDEQSGAPATKPVKRRAASKAQAPQVAEGGETAKSAAAAVRKKTKPSSAPAAEEKPAAKPRRKKAEASTEPETTELQAPPAASQEAATAAAQRSRRPERSAESATPALSRQAEEWSPSRRSGSAPQPPAAEKSLPGNGAGDASNQSSPAAAPAPRETEMTAPAPSTQGRKYPVYIPRHVARQMEQEGQEAPLAVPPDAVPEAMTRAVAEAAAHAPAQPFVRQDRRHEPRHDRRGEPRHDRRDDRREDSRPDRREDSQPEPRAQEPSPDDEIVAGEGIVEISGKGFGFIRDAKRGFVQHPSDIFVTPETVRRYNLRDGQWLKGEVRRSTRGSQLQRLMEINGDDPENCRFLPAFDELTVVSPMERLTLETTPERTTTRIIDLFTPIGKGQRGLIVAPPRTGKTTFLQHIADSIVKNHPDVTLIILLVDERPEEVTDIKRTVPSAEIMASSNDMDVKSHTRIAQLAIERARRLVEAGKDAFILLDSITRVGRAFNNAMAGGGRTMSGGVDARALEIPRKLFAAARNTEEAGSLTIIATALIETGSRMDELIFNEFKGTGNMELVLDRKIADQRIYPAIDIFQSGTRREELLIPADDLSKVNLIRRGLAGHKPMEAIERLLYFLRKFPTNAQMLREIPS